MFIYLNILWVYTHDLLHVYVHSPFLLHILLQLVDHAEQFQKLLGSKCPRIVRVYSKTREAVDYPIPRNQISNDKNRHPLEDDENIRRISLHRILRDYSNPEYKHRIANAETGRDYRREIVKFDRTFAKSKRKPEKITDEEVDAYKKLIHEASVDELKHYDIVLSTCSGSACQRLIQGCNIVQLIVDECAMCTEPETLIPLVAFTKAERVVLIGDHKQLQPIIRNREAKNLGLKVSLFERYSKLAHMLDVQYRKVGLCFQFLFCFQLSAFSPSFCFRWRSEINACSALHCINSSDNTRICHSSW